jgi:hypothetical protein
VLILGIMAENFKDVFFTLAGDNKNCLYLRHRVAVAGDH